MSKTADALSGSSQYINSILAKSRSVLGASSYGVPLVTYGLIGLTTVILAYVTLIENSESAAPLSTSESSILSTPFYSPEPEPEPESSSIFGGKSKRKHKHKKSKTKRRVHS
jgi:hypothetical protein